MGNHFAPVSEIRKQEAWHLAKLDARRAAVREKFTDKNFLKNIIVAGGLGAAAISLVASGEYVAGVGLGLASAGFVYEAGSDIHAAVEESVTKVTIQQE